MITHLKLRLLATAFTMLVVLHPSVTDVSAGIPAASTFALISFSDG